MPKGELGRGAHLPYVGLESVDKPQSLSGPCPLHIWYVSSRVTLDSAG